MMRDMRGTNTYIPHDGMCYVLPGDDLKALVGTTVDVIYDAKIEFRRVMNLEEYTRCFQGEKLIMHATMRAKATMVTVTEEGSDLVVKRFGREIWRERI